MAKVKVHNNPLTPSQEIIASANHEFFITDLVGRTIGIKKPGVLAQYRLVEIIGDAAKNEVYMNMIMPILFVTSINGNSVPVMTSKTVIEALIQQLDNHGIQAVSNGIIEHFSEVSDEKGAKDKIKK